MTFSRRQVLLGTSLAVTASAGCLHAGEANEQNGGAEPPTTVPEEPRVDEPPYEIEAQPDDGDAWNDLYLCEHMPDDSDLAFKRVSAPRADLLLSINDHEDGDAYAVRSLTSATDVREVFEMGADGGDTGGNSTGESEKPLDAIDFDEYVLLVVEDGYGSGSVAHHWTRVEATERGLHLHGCLMKPYARTADITSRHSVVTVERPSTLELARVSLTVSPERRVHVNSTEGVVTVDSRG